MIHSLNINCPPHRTSRVARARAHLACALLSLDMNWRNTPHGHASTVSKQQAVMDEKVYSSPNTELLPDLAAPGTGWFDWIKAQGLRTYFNDHPCPANNGTAMQVWRGWWWAVE